MWTCQHTCYKRNVRSGDLLVAISHRTETIKPVSRRKARAAPWGRRPTGGAEGTIQDMVTKARGFHLLAQRPLLLPIILISFFIMNTFRWFCLCECTEEVLMLRTSGDKQEPIVTRAAYSVHLPRINHDTRIHHQVWGLVISTRFLAFLAQKDLFTGLAGMHLSCWR